MTASWFRTYRPSLRRWTRGFAIAWLFSALMVAPVAIALLDQIYDDARITYSKEIPNLLDRNRNALKLERLSSFVRVIAFTPDDKEQRRTLVQLQTLAQGFDLDDDLRLSQGTALVVANARKIFALRKAHPPVAATSLATDPGKATSTPDAATEVRRLSDEALQVLASLADYITTDAALTADRMASRIQSNAAKVKHGCLAALAFFIAFGLFLIWFFQGHVLNPIAAAVRGLEAVSTSDEAEITLARSRFVELDTIGRSVEQYARFASDLRTANAALHALSHQDGLTGLANRRSFDADLGAACRRASEGIEGTALLFIDIDHFKRLNDRFGHLAGDQCLRQVGMVLQQFCAQRGAVAARYGGEEFAVILSGVGPDQACETAEEIRAMIASTPFSVADAQQAIDVTVSVGVAQTSRGMPAMATEMIREADEGLYQAKRAGRNLVRMFAEAELPLSKAS